MTGFVVKKRVERVGACEAMVRRALNMVGLWGRRKLTVGTIYNLHIDV